MMMFGYPDKFKKRGRHFYAMRHGAPSCPALVADFALLALAKTADLREAGVLCRLLSASQHPRFLAYPLMS